jgi:hypothetical protein
MMKHLTRTLGLAALVIMTIAGCQTGGGGQGSTLQADATPFTTGELYMYFAEKTQVRQDGGIYYSGFGALTKLEDGERVEGTWGSYDGGKLCQHIEGRDDSCEIYYHNGDVVSVVMGDKTMMAPKLMDGNQLDLLATGTSRKMFTQEETIALVSGKTHAWENYNGAYYSPDFKLYTLWDGEKESGKWSVTDEGALCWHIPSWGSGPCESFFMSADGTLMSVYKGKEEPADELRDGNQLNNL